LFNHDQDGCVRSLAALGMLDTEVLLPGHGPVWRGSIREGSEKAAAQASS
jgi:flavorubredoxin